MLKKTIIIIFFIVAALIFFKSNDSNVNKEETEEVQKINTSTDIIKKELKKRIIKGPKENGNSFQEKIYEKQNEQILETKTTNTTSEEELVIPNDQNEDYEEEIEIVGNLSDFQDEIMIIESRYETKLAELSERKQKVTEPSELSIIGEEMFGNEKQKERDLSQLLGPNLYIQYMNQTAGNQEDIVPQINDQEELEELDPNEIIQIEE